LFAKAVLDLPTERRHSLAVCRCVLATGLAYLLGVPFTVLPLIAETPLAVFCLPLAEIFAAVMAFV
jgi:hypothetical protein